MADKPEDREMHIRRYIGTNANRDKIPEIWADMLRIDKWSTIYNGGSGTSGDWPQGQKIYHTLYWNDDPNGSTGGDGNADVVVDFILKIVGPNEDPDNPSKWIEIPVTKSMLTRASRLSDTGSGNDQKKTVTFHTPPSDATDLGGREVSYVKVTHKDTNMDNDDSFKNGGVVPYDQYVKYDDTENTSSYANAAITTAYVSRASHESGTGNTDQRKKWRIRNDFLIEQFDTATGDFSEGPPFDPPFIFDPYQILWNVKFSHDVIVVIADGGNLSNAANPSIHQLISKAGAERLKEFMVPYQNDGIQPGYYCTAYRVSADAGEWLKTTYIGTRVFATDYPVAVFAIDDKLGIDGSLDRAVAGMKLVIPAQYVGFDPAGHHASDLPIDIAPAGLLWNIEVVGARGRNITWKMRYDKHRRDSGTSPPNVMVQCYPLDTTWSYPPDHIIFTGYRMFVYRLDAAGTGTVYGMQPGYIMGDVPQVIDPIWNQVIAGEFLQYRGIPFADPPPLINADLAANVPTYMPPFDDSGVGGGDGG